MKVPDMTVDELRTLIREVVQDVLAERRAAAARAAASNRADHAPPGGRASAGGTANP